MRERLKSFRHQKEARQRARDREAFALLMEQGTGKTKVVIDEAADLYERKEIDTLLVIAPNGVHVNWIEIEIPRHMPESIVYAAAFWSASMTRKETLAFEAATTAPHALRVLTINVEALMLDRARQIVRDFLDDAKGAMVVLDESHKFKNPGIQRTKFVMNLRNRAQYRRILTGTPVTNAPFDAWSQFMFLDPAIIGVPSFTAFKSEYAEMEDANSGIMRHIAARGARWAPQIVKRDSDGTPRYKNLDKLKRLLDPHSYRVLKADCLDLPDKVYERALVELTRAQRKLYDRVRDELLIEWGSEVSAVNRLTSLVRLQQIVCGYLVIEAGAHPVPLFPQPEDNPRIAAMLDAIEEAGDQSVIVWARFREDIRAIAQTLRMAYGGASVVEYHGDVNRQDRTAALARMQDGTARFFVGQQGSGGTGTTITAASLCIYYSNTFSLTDRLQSEDRAHRIGQTKKVTYIDIEARNTIDRKLIDTMLAKKKMSDEVTGDKATDWLRRKD